MTRKDFPATIGLVMGNEIKIEQNSGILWRRFTEHGLNFYVASREKSEIYVRELADCKPVSGETDLFIGTPIGMTREETKTANGKSLWILNYADSESGRQFEIRLYPGCRPMRPCYFRDEEMNEHREYLYSKANVTAKVREEEKTVKGFARVAGSKHFTNPSSHEAEDTPYYVELHPWVGPAVHFFAHDGDKGVDYFINTLSLESEGIPSRVVLEKETKLDWLDYSRYRVSAKWMS